MRITLSAALLIVTTTGAWANNHEVGPGCFPREKVETMLTQGDFASLSRGTAPDGRLVEHWLNSKGQTMTISYKKPQNSEDKTISDVCIIMATQDTSYNGATVDAMYESLKQSAPKL